MELGSFIDFMASFFGQIFTFLSSMTFSVYGVSVNYGAIIFAVIVVGFVVSMYWKGARS